LKVNDENRRIRIQDPDPNPNPLVRGMDPRIRIHTKMSWIRNTDRPVVISSIKRFKKSKLSWFYPGHSSSVIRRLEEEISRLEEIKKANIEKFVTNLRNELHRLWDDCYYSEKQRSVTLIFFKGCKSFYPSSANRDLLPDILLSVDHCCGPGLFIPDPDFSIPDPGSKRSRIRNKEFEYF
jgi:hypothetical protein